jgi:hypothetical protein
MLSNIGIRIVQEDKLVEVVDKIPKMKEKANGDEFLCLVPGSFVEDKAESDWGFSTGDKTLYFQFEWNLTKTVKYNCIPKTVIGRDGKPAVALFSAPGKTIADGEILQISKEKVETRSDKYTLLKPMNLDNLFE